MGLLNNLTGILADGPVELGHETTLCRGMFSFFKAFPTKSFNEYADRFQ